MFSMCVADLSPGRPGLQEQCPPEPLRAQPAPLRAPLGGVGLFHLGLVATPFITRKEHLALSSPFPRAGCAPCRSHALFSLIPTLIS